MEIKGAIFDLDGTLFDSMYIWETVAADYLRSLGVRPWSDLREKTKDITLEEAAEYIRCTGGLRLPVSEIMAGIDRRLETQYSREVDLKPGVRELLTKLDSRGVSMCIASATDRYLVESALKNRGVAQYFRAVVTCTEVGVGKMRPDIYFRAQEVLGTRREETVVFEDALHCIRTAKRAGFPVAAVADPSVSDPEEARRLADWYLDTPADWFRDEMK